MDTLEKALLAFENVLNNIDENELKEIVAKIDNMDNQNISYFDYLNETEEQYSLLYNFEGYFEEIDFKSFCSGVMIEEEHESLSYTNKLDKFKYSSIGLEVNYSQNDSIMLESAA